MLCLNLLVAFRMTDFSFLCVFYFSISILISAIYQIKIIIRLLVSSRILTLVHPYAKTSIFLNVCLSQTETFSTVTSNFITVKICILFIYSHLFVGCNHMLIFLYTAVSQTLYTK